MRYQGWDQNGRSPIAERAVIGHVAGPFNHRHRYRQPPGRPCPTDSASANIWHERGINQEMLGKSEQAIANYTRALLVGGPDAQIVFDLASVLAETGHLDRAIERYRQVVELDPDRQDAWNNLGDLLMTVGLAEAAIEAFRRAVELDPQDPTAHYNLADSLDQIHRPDQAAPHWKRFLRFADPTCPHAAYARTRARCSHSH